MALYVFILKKHFKAEVLAYPEAPKECYRIFVIADLCLEKTSNIGLKWPYMEAAQKGGKQR